MPSNRRKVKPINGRISNTAKYYSTRINAEIHLYGLIRKMSKTVLSKKSRQQSNLYSKRKKSVRTYSRIVNGWHHFKESKENVSFIL